MNLLKYSRRRMSYLRSISLISLNATLQKLVSRFIVNLNRFSNWLTQIMTKRKSNLVRSKQVQKRVIRGKILYRKRNIMEIEKKRRNLQEPFKFHQEAYVSTVIMSFFPNTLIYVGE